jgi:hypothetical protein
MNIISGIDRQESKHAYSAKVARYHLAYKEDDWNLAGSLGNGVTTRTHHGGKG